MGIPWGIGAWGTWYEIGALPKRPTKFEDRVLFIDEVRKAITTGMYPNLKASIYFDSLSSIITPLDVEIIQLGDIASHNEIQVFENSPDLVPTFKEYLNAEPFTKNDHMIAEAVQIDSQWPVLELTTWMDRIVGLAADFSSDAAGEFVEERYEEASQGGYIPSDYCTKYDDHATHDDPTW